MAEFDISSATSSNMTTIVEDVTIDTLNADGLNQQKETTYICTNFSKWFGIYKKIPEVKIAFDMRTIWTIGKGYLTSDNYTRSVLDNISGCGIETLNMILKNMLTIKRVCGDAYAEIIRDENGMVLNIKCLNPSRVRVVYNENGRIIRYEYITDVKTGKDRKLKPDQIFHITNKRVADEIHGVSDIEALEKIIEASNENFEDMRKVMHRFVKPMMKFILDTDDETKINAFVAKMDAIVNKGENIYLPKGTVEHELISVPSNSTLNSSEWRNYLKNWFFQVVGIPQIIMGSSGEFSESSAKIAYLAFEQSVSDEQREIEAQFWNQIYMHINLEFPASLRNELLSDESKDKNQGMEFQKGDTTAGVAE